MTDNKKQMTIVVNGFDIEDVTSAIRNQVVGTVGESLDWQIKQAIKERLEVLIDDAAKEQIRAAVVNLFAEGWQPTNDMGIPQGERVSLSERVRRVLDRRDHYSGSGGTLIENEIKKATTTGLERVIAEEVAAARKKLQAMFDDVLKARFAETLRKALGGVP